MQVFNVAYVEKGFLQVLTDVVVRISALSICRNLFHYRGTKGSQLETFFCPQAFLMVQVFWFGFGLLVLFFFFFVNSAEITASWNHSLCNHTFKIIRKWYYAGWHLSYLSYYKHRIHVSCLKFLGRFGSWRLHAWVWKYPPFHLFSSFITTETVEIISDRFCFWQGLHKWFTKWDF